MATDDKILSQAEIDALLLKNAPKSKTKPPAVVPVSLRPPEPPPKVKDITPPLKVEEPEPPAKIVETKPKVATPLSKIMAKINAAPPKAGAAASEASTIEQTSKAAAPTPKVIVPLPKSPKSEPPKAAPPRTTVQSTPVTSTASYESYTSDEVANLQKTVADLTRHVIKLTVAMQKTDMLEMKVNQIASIIRFSPDSMTTFERQIEEIRDILEKMQNKNDSLREEFQCGKCHSDKAVAVHVKCTSCGNESWMGWWPEKEKEHVHEPEKTADVAPPADTVAPEGT